MYATQRSRIVRLVQQLHRHSVEDGVAKQLSTTEEEALLEVPGLVLCDAESGGTTGDSISGTASSTGGSKRKDDLVYHLLEDDLEPTS